MMTIWNTASHPKRGLGNPASRFFAASSPFFSAIARPPRAEAERGHALEPASLRPATSLRMQLPCPWVAL